MSDGVWVGKVSDFADGDYKIFELGRREIGVFRLGDKIVAYENICPHMGGPVCQGGIFRRVDRVVQKGGAVLGPHFTDERHIVCPWHGFEFSLETGAHPGDPNVRLRAVKLTIRDDEIYLDKPAGREGKAS